jgi:hypothetical protein
LEAAMRAIWTKCLAVTLSSFMAMPAISGTISIPAGTAVFGETDERVTSRIEKDGWEEGDAVKAHVWRDVVVDGQVVIKAGTPIRLRISEVKKAKIAGVKGKLELEALSTTGVDGRDLMLDGGYDKSGHGRKALSITLAACVAWPLIFIKGKAAVLDAGTVFDAEVQSTGEVRVAEDAPRKIKLGGGAFDVEPLYDEMDPDGKSQLLPVKLTNCRGDVVGAQVVTVDGKDITPIPVALGPATEADGCRTAHGTIDLKVLGKHFTKGINRFEVRAGEAIDEVVLDIEL